MSDTAILFAVLSGAIYSIVEFGKKVITKDPTTGKLVVNWAYVASIALGMLIAFGLPLDFFLGLEIDFTLPYVGEFLSGFLLGGLGAKVIYELPGFVQPALKLN